MVGWKERIVVAAWVERRDQRKVFQSAVMLELLMVARLDASRAVSLVELRDIR